MAQQPVWRERAVRRSLDAAEARAQQRAQRILDAAFDLTDERGTTEFTILEVTARAKQSLRSFYQYFDGKDQLLLALFEETIREAVDELQAAVDAERDPLARLRAFVVSLHELCDPGLAASRPDAHNRRPISDFSLQLVGDHPQRVQATFLPISRMLADLLDAAHRAGAIQVSDVRRATTLVLRAAIYNWFEDRLVRSMGPHITAEDSWQFCFHGLRARTG
jgi:AcrR family transcriptional regulator